MKTIFTFLFLSFYLSANAQIDHSINEGGCGTVTSPKELQDIYDFVQHNPAAYQQRGSAAAPDSIPLSIHIVGTDAGTGYYSLTNLFQVICQLNQRFAPTGFHFYIQWPLQYIDNTAYYAHDFNTGDMMMAANNVANSVNVYFVQDPAGNCGYYTYWNDAVAIGKNCAGSNSTTLVHELGHYFSLPHTFSGWENGSVPSNPELVTRNSPFANCIGAGDGFCDTYADYLSSRWSCPGPVGKVDRLGDLYHLDSSMYMSYSSDVCQSQFSNMQIAAMRDNLYFTRQAFGGAIIPPPVALDSVKVFYPKDTLYTNIKKAVWRSMPGADYYLVRICLQTAPSVVLQTSLVADTTMNITVSLVNEGRYLVNITPINAHNTCMQYVTLQKFIFSNATGKLGIQPLYSGQKGIQIYPNPHQAGLSPISVTFNALSAGNYEISLVNINGQLVCKKQIVHPGGDHNYELPVIDLANGIYFVRCKSAAGQYVQKLVIQP